MKRTGMVVLFGAALCAYAYAAPVVYTVDLSNAGEVPPNASPATGTGTVVFDTTANTMFITFNFADLLAGTTASHIHCCTAVRGTGTAGVATQVPRFVGFPVGVTAGSYTNTFDMTLLSSYNPSFVTNHGGTAASAEAALVAGAAAGESYLNIHTTLFPGGEIQGFLRPAPEPATVVFTGIGLAAAFLARKRLARG